MDYGLGYSFSYEFREPKIKSRFERKQIISKIEYFPGQEIQICGLADPMFRATEAILKYFGGYLTMRIKADKISNKEGVIHQIYKRTKFAKRIFSYSLLDWQIVANYYNILDDQKIRIIYSIDRFEKNEYKTIWRSKPNYKIYSN